MDRMPSYVDMSQIKNYISRCVVCESLYSLIIVHSDDDKPSCPEEKEVVTPEGRTEYLRYEVPPLFLIATI